MALAGEEPILKTVRVGDPIDQAGGVAPHMLGVRGKSAKGEQSYGSFARRRIIFGSAVYGGRGSLGAPEAPRHLMNLRVRILPPQPMLRSLHSRFQMCQNLRHSRGLGGSSGSLVVNFWFCGGGSASFRRQSLLCIFQFPFSPTADRFDS